MYSARTVIYDDNHDMYNVIRKLTCKLYDTYTTQYFRSNHNDRERGIHVRNESTKRSNVPPATSDLDTQAVLVAGEWDAGYSGWTEMWPTGFRPSVVQRLAACRHSCSSRCFPYIGVYGHFNSPHCQPSKSSDSTSCHLSS